RQINTVVAQLPAETDRPIVYKADLSQQPSVQLALVDDRLPPEELYRLADEVLRPAIEGLSGVSLVRVVGGRQAEVRVEVDPVRLEGYGLALSDVQSALAQANLDLPAGSLTQAGRE